MSATCLPERFAAVVVTTSTTTQYDPNPTEWPIPAARQSSLFASSQRSCAQPVPNQRPACAQPAPRRQRGLVRPSGAFPGSYEPRISPSSLDKWGNGGHPSHGDPHDQTAGLIRITAREALETCSGCSVQRTPTGRRIKRRPTQAVSRFQDADRSPDSREGG